MVEPDGIEPPHFRDLRVTASSLAGRARLHLDNVRRIVALSSAIVTYAWGTDLTFVRFAV